jgi:hypothetical protein
MAGAESAERLCVARQVDSSRGACRLDDDNALGHVGRRAEPEHLAQRAVVVMLVRCWHERRPEDVGASAGLSAACCRLRADRVEMPFSDKVLE